VSTGLSTGSIDTALDTVIVTGTTYYLQLHTGDPGAAGTANIATNNTRQPVTFAAAAAKAKASNLDAQWTNVPATETYSFCSLWTLASGGTFVGSGTVTGGGVVATNTFDLPSGSVVASITGAA